MSYFNINLSLHKNSLEDSLTLKSLINEQGGYVVFLVLSEYSHCKVIIGRNPIEANANTVAIQLPGNPAAYIGKCFTPY